MKEKKLSPDRKCAVVYEALYLWVTDVHRRPYFKLAAWKITNKNRESPLTRTSGWPQRLEYINNHPSTDNYCLVGSHVCWNRSWLWGGGWPWTDPQMIHQLITGLTHTRDNSDLCIHLFPMCMFLDCERKTCFLHTARPLPPPLGIRGFEPLTFFIVRPPTSAPWCGPKCN